MSSKGKLYYGDNLEVLREHIPSESVDLIYLDPPFNSNATYNVLFKSPKTGEGADSQIKAFDDTWHWGEDDAIAVNELMHSGHEDIANLIQALRRFLGENDMMAYLVMMAIRLLELHRVLKPTGSLYLHCDPTASHYLKLILDAIFGHENFRNEIVWKRAETVKGNFGQGSKRFDCNTDNIYFYTKSNSYTFNPIFQQYSLDYINSFYKHSDPETGRRYQLISMTGPGGAAKGNPSYEVMGVTRFWRYSKENMKQLIDAGLVVQTGPNTVPRKKLYLDEGKGVPLQSLWTDVPSLHSQSNERLGYPTQKPVALLERIIQASSNKDDVVLDPFCGCGTAIHAAQKLNRTWIGIDITQLAISLIEKRLKDAFPEADFEVIGSPKDLEDAEDLAIRDKYQFQWWALSLVGAQPYQDKKKGADSGIDGLIYFLDSDEGEYKKIVVSVKGGNNVNVSMLRDLAGTMEREKAAMGFFITLVEPTEPMRKEAAGKDPYISPLNGSIYPRIQILTIKGLMNGTERARYPADLGLGLGMLRKVKHEN